MTSSPASQADAQIQERLQAKQYREAFGMLLPHYRDRVFRLTFSMLRDRAMAEDTTQDIFLRVWRALPGFAGQSQLSTWIYAISKNACLSELRKRRPQVSLDSGRGRAVRRGPGPGVRTTRTIPRPSASASCWTSCRNAIARPSFCSIWRTNPMSRPRRASGLPLGTVKALLHRARKRLIELTKRSRMPPYSPDAAQQHDLAVERSPAGLAGRRPRRS